MTYVNSLADALSQHPFSNSVAAMGSLAWFWLPYVEFLSSGAAKALPVLSVAWLAIQIYSHFRKR